MNLKTKFNMIFLISIASILVIGIINIYTASTVKSEWNFYTHNVAKRYSYISDLKGSMGYGGGIHQFKNYVIRGQEKQINSFNKHYNNFMQTLRKYRKLDLSTNEKNALRDIERVFGLYKKNLSVAIKLNKEGKTPKQIDKVIKINDTPAIKALKTLENEFLLLSKSKTEHVNSSIGLINTLSVVFIIVVLLAFVFIYIVQKTSIFDNLLKLNNAIKNLITNNSRESVRITVETQDEFGDIANSFNNYLQKIDDDLRDDMILIDDVKRVVNEVKHGTLSTRIEKDSNNQSLKELKDIFNDMLNIMAEQICSDIKKVQVALEKFHALDFTHRIENPTGKTSQGLNALAEIINKILVENKQNGLTLQESSRVLLSNVDSLNTNASRAAAALEETSASLGEMTENISSNTNNIIKMAEYANRLTSSSNEGKTLASQTTSAMNEIDEEVRAINEAISVIDQIAFQTNILSLNAAVEAATAGEAGKGFAVVAQEVRNLASRSAEAANEIKKLVENATQKASHGKSISDKMIDGYIGLNDNIAKTIELISSVESASKEQLSGIEQINDAITSLDSQTQQNASIANETHNVALKTDEIAKLIVSSANDKNFIGKDSVKAKKLDISAKVPSKSNVVSSSPRQSNKPKKVATTPSKPKAITPQKSLNVVKSQASDDDEWASF